MAHCNDDHNLEMDSCRSARGPILEGWGSHYPIQKEGPRPVDQLQGNHSPGSPGQMLSVYTNLAISYTYGCLSV